MKLTALFFLIFLTSVLHIAVADSEPLSTAYHFKLTKGSGTPVCDAYLERLNKTVYEKPPFCGRPETTLFPGFTSLNRVPLTPEAAQTLFPRILKFMAIRHQGSKEQDEADEASRIRNGLGPVYPPGEVANFLQHGDIVAWRYDPRVDIDNDGKPDNILVWQGYGLGGPQGVCGRPTILDGFTYDSSQPQVAFVLADTHDRLDEKRTMGIFGHPSGGYRLPDGTMAMGFRPLGFRIGIFKYQDNFYFDTFFDFWGDFQNKRKGDPRLQDTLGVFLRKNGKTQQVCEYHMSR